MFKSVENNQNFPEMEKKWLKHWYEKGITKKYLQKNNQSEKYFSFLDGPITANNPMGVHHAWGRTYKDLWPRFYNLLGYKQRFQNGFDCQGLWVEVEVEKELGLKTKKDIENLVPGDKYASIAKFVQLCKDRVMKFSKVQTEQSKRLGYFADWDHSYFTMSDENNYMIWRFLKICYENGWIYKGRESVPWCPRCETAISQHEMLTEDYKELVHESIYFKLPIINNKSQITNKHQTSNIKHQNEFLLVWTTTPWTILANIAVAIDKTFNYSLVEVERERLWLAANRIKEVFKDKVHKVIKTVKGEELVGLKYKGPFDDLPAVKKVAEENSNNFHTVFATDQNILPVTTAEGTGMVHTAVSAGTEDFKMGKKLSLPMIPVIQDNADYLPDLGFLSGKNAKKHPEIILDFLKEKGFVFKIEKYKHRYPACWRCKTELVWKVEDEWYVAMDKPSQLKVKSEKLRINKTLRERMIEVAKKIKWMPEFGLDRELDWLKNMHDWLISKKNRYWGLALPIYECGGDGGCGGFEVIGSKEELNKRAVSGWQNFAGHSPHKPYVDEVKIKCSKCGQIVSRIDDVGNPWLDAGIVAYSTISENNQGESLYLKNKKEWRNWFPADFITESFPGQFKNWFYALIAMSTVLENEKPFKTVLGFGTMFDETGRPFHKSLGNTIEFVEGANRFGADIIRWICISNNPADNILFGEHKVKDVTRRFYLMLWNVYKFFVEYVNLDELSRSSIPLFSTASPPKGGSPKRLSQKGYFRFNILDRWILSRFSSLVVFVEKNLKEYNAKDSALEIEKFVSDLSTWYIRRSRNRIWVNSEDKKDKEAFYSSLYYILVNLSIVLSPFMPFISEEIYVNLTEKESVHLESWPEINPNLKYQNSKLEKEMEMARKVVEVGHSKRKEEGKKVRMPLAKLELEVEGDFSKISPSVWQIVLDELNIKNIAVNKTQRFPKKEMIVSEDDLNHEGSVRDLIRSIQSKRKELGLKQTDFIVLTVPESYLEDSDFIKKKVMAKKVSVGQTLVVSK